MGEGQVLITSFMKVEELTEGSGLTCKRKLMQSYRKADLCR